MNLTDTCNCVDLTNPAAEDVTLDEAVEAAKRLAIHAASLEKYAIQAPVAFKVEPGEVDIFTDELLARIPDAVVSEAGSVYREYHGGPRDGQRENLETEVTWLHVTRNDHVYFPRLRVVAAGA